MPLALLLLACGTQDDPDVLAVLDLTGDVAAGEAVFEATCGFSSCHGPTGDDGANGVKFSEHIHHHTDYELVDFVLNGTGDMPPVGISPQETADVLAWLRATYAH